MSQNVCIEVYEILNGAFTPIEKVEICTQGSLSAMT